MKLGNRPTRRTGSNAKSRLRHGFIPGTVDSKNVKMALEERLRKKRARQARFLK